MNLFDSMANLSSNQLTVVMTAVGIIVGAIITWHFSRAPSKRLSYVSDALLLIDPTQNLLRNSTAFLSDNIKLFFKDELIESLVRVEFKVWNSGRVPLRALDSVSSDPIGYKVGENARLLQASITKVSDISNRAQIKADTSSEVSIGFEYLEPHQGFVLIALLTGEIADPVLSGKLIGMPRGFKRVAPETTFSFLVGPLSLVILLITVAVARDQLLTLSPTLLPYILVLSSAVPVIVTVTFARRSPIPKALRGSGFRLASGGANTKA